MSSYDDGKQQFKRIERVIELAAILKEKKHGNMRSLEGIIHRFSIQEGVKPETTREYIESFKIVGLLKFTLGKKTWKYNSELEEGIFGVTI